MVTFKKAVYAAFFLFLFLPAVNAQMSGIESPGIVINLPSRTLELYSGTTLVKEYPIAIGKPSTPTPLGNYSIVNMEVNPVWIPPGQGYIVESGPDNPLGYRWMGFLPLYGIHGTNASWAIGLAVSNGCVRMNESDAEELFDSIAYGTPVQVTYERIKIRLNGRGEASIGVYPDIYGYQPITTADVYSKLAQYGLIDWISDNFVQQLIDQGSDKQVTFAQLFSLKINDQQKNERGVWANNTLYVPVWPVASELKTNILWDEQNHLVRGPKCAVPGLVKGDIVYVTNDNLQKLFGGQQTWQPDENILEINAVRLLVNNTPVACDVQMIDGILAVPVLPLAEALGQKINWDAIKKAATLQNRSLPVGLIADRPYIQITKIHELFRAYVFWNEPVHTIELTYPFQ